MTMSREVCRDQAIGMGCRLMRSHAPTTTSNPLSCSSTLARSQGVSEDLRGGGGGGGAHVCGGVARARHGSSRKAALLRRTA